MLARLLIFACVLTGVSAAAEPSNRGTIRITGRVSEMASLRFHSSSVVGEGVTGSNSGSDALSYTLNLDDVGIVPGRDNGARGARVTLALRSNSAYVLTATVQGSGFRSGRGEISLDDIGFGLPTAQIAPSGDRARAENLVEPLGGKFDHDPLLASLNSGRPQYAATLGDLARGPVPVLQGDRISFGGALDAPNNALLVTTHYAVHPQYFRRNDAFEAVVTYTLSTP